VEIDDQAVVGGLAGIHQFVRIGRLAMVGGFAKVIKDIPPFSIVDGQPARIYGLNSRGLQRRGISQETRMEIKRAYHILCGSGKSLPLAVEEIRATIAPSAERDQLLKFLVDPSRMGVLIKDHEMRGKRGSERFPAEEFEFSHQTLPE
jgi:UDP-N-acetylglucosamine acyltransferase